MTRLREERLDRAGRVHRLAPGVPRAARQAAWVEPLGGPPCRGTPPARGVLVSSVRRYDGVPEHAGRHLRRCVARDSAARARAWRRASRARLRAPPVLCLKRAHAVLRIQL